ncbi:MAG: vWA domain-containing protein [Hyphomicrobiaceae bacterium]
MSEAGQLPRPLEPFVAFAGVLRANGFPAAPEQTQSFITAIGLLGPRNLTQVHRAALAIFAPVPERRTEFDALFRLVFLGQTLAAPSLTDADEDDVEAFDAADGRMETIELDGERDAGMEATPAERLATRGLAASDASTALHALRRRAPRALPRQVSRRWHRSRGGRRPDIKRALRTAVRRHGEILDLPRLGRRTRQRRIVLLIDVSGSMAPFTDNYMRFAHALTRGGERVETFTLGTRLTRVTRALRLRNQRQALTAASTLVADWDGGTRLGDALTAFLDVPRFVAHARGAFVIVLSDGLERGDARQLVSAMERLSRLAWSVLWLNPLAADAAYEPQTEAMQAILPFVDRIGPGANPMQLVDGVLTFARRAIP